MAASAVRETFLPLARLTLRSHLSLSQRIAPRSHQTKLTSDVPSARLLHSISIPTAVANGVGGRNRNLYQNKCDATLDRIFKVTKAQMLSTNANPSEVDKFTSFASHWWDSRSNPLVGMNPIRVKFMRDVVDVCQPADGAKDMPHRLPLHNKRVLDIGCGGGLLTESFSRLGASLVTGVDAAPRVVEVARMHSFHKYHETSSEQSNEQSTKAEAKNIRYVGGKTVEEFASYWLSEREKERKLSETNQSRNHDLFNIVTALEVIEHVPNPTSLLRAATSLLEPNGILFVSTINRTMKSYGLAIVAAEHITGKVPVGTHDWTQFRSPEEVEEMVCGSDKSGDNSTMKQIGLSGMVVNPLSMEWSLNSSDVDVNWIGAYQKAKPS